MKKIKRKGNPQPKPDPNTLAAPVQHRSALISRQTHRSLQFYYPCHPPLISRQTHRWLPFYYPCHPPLISRQTHRWLPFYYPCQPPLISRQTHRWLPFYYPCNSPPTLPSQSSPAKHTTGRTDAFDNTLHASPIAHYANSPRPHLKPEPEPLNPKPEPLNPKP